MFSRATNRKRVRRQFYSFSAFQCLSYANSVLKHIEKPLFSSVNTHSSRFVCGIAEVELSDDTCCALHQLHTELYPQSLYLVYKTHYLPQLYENQCQKLLIYGICIACCAASHIVATLVNKKKKKNILHTW